MLSLADATFIVTDIETTGLSPEKNRVTEVACVFVEGGEIVGEQRTLVNPEQFIPQAISQMTGITNAMVMGAPKGGEIFPKVRDWFGDEGVFTAHNVAFDYNFLQSSFARHSVRDLDLTKLCTMRLSRRLFPARKSHSLTELTNYLGIRVQGRHSALGDAQATAQVLVTLLEMLQEEHDCETVEEVLGFQYRTIGAFKSTPANVKALEPTLAALPHRPGVYRMIGKRGEILYVGKAKSLKDRVGSYFRPGAEHTTKISEMVNRVRSIETEETGSELGALLLESQRIKEYQPKYNTLLKRYRRYAFLRLTTNEEFPRVELALEVEPDGSEYFGPFNGRNSVEMVIETVNQVFQLRECVDPLAPDIAATPCIYHQIKRCGAPCAAVQTVEEYRREVDEVRAFLSGSEEGIIGRLHRKMMEHAELLEFEEAARLRNRISELRGIFVRQQQIAESINTNNVLILLPSVAPRRRELFLIRYGRLARHMIIGSRMPDKTLRRLVDRIYFDGSQAPPHFRKPEIDEVKIISGYLGRHRDEGKFVYVGPEDTTDSVVRRLTAVWR